MTQDNVGFYEEPKNGHGITRSRTTLQLRSWDMPKSLGGIEQFNTEIGKAEFPGIYILISGKKVYVGEAKNLYSRLKTHVNTPDDKIKDWNRVIIINDGRPAALSIFNDTVVRREIEHYLGKLLKLNKYNVVSQADAQIQTSSQKYCCDSLKQELDAFLMKKTLITKVIQERGQEEVLPDELRKRLENSGRKLAKWGAHEGYVDDVKVFIRPGSEKTRGWQITFRDRFKDALESGNGALLIPRDGVLLIPFKEVQKVIPDISAYDQNTIDIYVTFGEDIVTLSYKESKLEVTECRLFKGP